MRGAFVGDFVPLPCFGLGGGSPYPLGERGVSPAPLSTLPGSMGVPPIAPMSVRERADRGCKAFFTDNAVLNPFGIVRLSGMGNGSAVHAEMHSNRVGFLVRLNPKDFSTVRKYKWKAHRSNASGHIQTQLCPLWRKPLGALRLVKRSTVLLEANRVQRHAACASF